MFKKWIVTVLILCMSTVLMFSSGITAHGQSINKPEATQDDLVRTVLAISGRFHSIEIGSSWDVVFRQSSSFGYMLEMSADGSMRGTYTFNLRSQTLRVQTVRATPQGAPRPRITIMAPTLQSVTLTGNAATLNWSPITSRDFTVNLSGGARASLNIDVSRNLRITTADTSYLTISGRADRLRLNSSGNSIVRAFDLQARDTRPVELRGSSVVEIAIGSRATLRARDSSLLRVRMTQGTRVNASRSGAASIVFVTNTNTF